MERKGRGEGGRRYRASTWPASMDLKREHERLVVEPGLAALTYIQLEADALPLDWDQRWRRPPEELKGVARFEGEHGGLGLRRLQVPAPRRRRRC
ncbi:unnamed protein product, partial [Musa acuminata var. zebrina]